MKTKLEKDIVENMRALLGEECEEVTALIDVCGNREEADTVRVIAFVISDMNLDECYEAKMEGGCVVIGKTTIRDMVETLCTMAEAVREYEQDVK